MTAGLRTGSGMLRAGTVLGWVSLATGALIVLLSVVKPSAPAWVPNPALLLVVGFLAGVVGAVLCWFGLSPDRRTVARNGMMRGGGGALLNALIMSFVTVTTVVQGPG